MRKLVYLSFVAVFALTSCGKDGKSVADSISNAIDAQSQTPADFLGNAELLQKAEDQLKELPQFKGKDVNVFQDVNFYGNPMSQRIEIDMQDPVKPENVDHYIYSNGAWSSPEPVQITGSDADMADNITPLKDIHFANVAKVYKAWTEKAESLEGWNKEPLDFIFFNLWVPNQTREFRTSNIKTDRAEYSMDFNLDGTVSEFKKM